MVEFAIGRAAQAVTNVFEIGRDPAEAEFREASVGFMDALARGDRLEAITKLGEMAKAAIDDAMYESPQERAERLERERQEDQKQEEERKRAAERLKEALRAFALESGRDPDDFEARLREFSLADRGEIDREVDQMIDRIHQSVDPSERADLIRTFMTGRLLKAEGDLLESLTQENFDEYARAVETRVRLTVQGPQASEQVSGNEPEPATDPVWGRVREIETELERGREPGEGPAPYGGTEFGVVRLEAGTELKIDPREMKLRGVPNGVELSGTFRLVTDSNLEARAGVVELDPDTPILFSGTITYPDGGVTRVRGGLPVEPRDGFAFGRVLDGRSAAA